MYLEVFWKGFGMIWASAKDKSDDFKHERKLDTGVASPVSVRHYTRKFLQATIVASHQVPITYSVCDQRKLFEDEHRISLVFL